MIYGIGTDIVEIDRIKDAVEKWGGRFLEKIYTGNEVLYCNKKKDPYPHLAARFAAKEAVMKALSIGGSELEDDKGIGVPGFRDIEVLNHPNGKPFIAPHGLIPGRSCNIHLSISHERKYAVANVVIEILS